MKVVVIDAATAVRARIVARLREAHVEVVGEASTIADALPLIERETPEAILADAELETVRGVEVVFRLRAAAPASWLAILTNALHLRGPCIAGGANAFFDKSREVEVLVEALRARTI